MSKYLSVGIVEGVTDQFEGEEFEGGVVALLGVMKVDEEEDVGPNVMLVVDMVIKALKHTSN